MNATETYKITGSEAVRIAVRDGLTIWADSGTFPNDYRREILPSEVAYVGVENVYVIVEVCGWRVDGAGCAHPPHGYNVNDFFRGGAYLGPDADGVEPGWADGELAAWESAQGARLALAMTGAAL